MPATTLTDSTTVRRYAIRTAMVDVDLNYANATTELEALYDWAFRACVGNYSTGQFKDTGRWFIVVNGRTYTARAMTPPTQEVGSPA